MPNCYAIEDLIPVVDSTAYLHPTAVRIGDVIIGPRCYVGPAASLRGDFGRITVREGSNVRDTCVIRGFPNSDTIIDTDGHIGRGAHIVRNVLVGMNAVVMDRSEIGEFAIVGAMAFVREGTIIPPRSLVLGVPARVARRLTDEEIAWKRAGTLEYQNLAVRSLASQRPAEPLRAAQPDRPRYKGCSNTTLGMIRTRSAQ